MHKHKHERKRARASLEKAGILAGLYNMIGITGESWSPNTSQPMARSEARTKLLLSRSCASLAAPRPVPSAPCAQSHKTHACAHA